MKLNIYIISHPIIKILSNSIIRNNKIIIKDSQQYKYLGFLLIYETMRKYINIKSIYIKKTNYVKTIYVTDPNKENYIFTNLIETYKIIGEITLLLPEIKVVNIDTKKKIEKIHLDLKNTNTNKEIIIFDTVLKSTWIIEIVKDLNKNKEICIENIKIACLACYNQILNKLGKEYPKLQIYTTEIIY
uniref:Uracil phosphoribosyltransferase n=1 Tax=Thuretia quercifolia TaxID=189650 RepID=A0A1Z1MKC8_9FLOR|nr:uracil phosphoribosyltransferase [Thuretia quercifolia]ARW66523.1 uracil phosphoribosyltransferase [Thuretia quercifolia]